MAQWFHRPAWKKAPLPAAPAASSATEGDRRRIWIFAGEAAGLAAGVVAKAPGEAIVLAPGAAGLHSFLELIRGLDAQPVSVVVVTDRARSVAGEAPSPEAAMLVGAARVVAQELPHIACRAVDVAVPPRGSYQERQVAAHIAGEAHADDVPAVAYRGSDRYVEGWVPMSSPGPSSNTGVAAPLRDGGVYLIVGGVGTVGYGHARALAIRAHAKLVLVQRAPEVRIDRIRELEALGAEVLAIRADATDVAAVRAAIAAARERFGALHGVIFAAGDVGAGLFRTTLELDAAAIDAIVRPRVLGLVALAQALRELAREGQVLDFCHVASSLASILGGVGRAAYAAATSFMDAFAEAERHRSPVPWTSVGWDAWQTDGGVASPFGELAIARDEGGEAFVQLLAHGAGPRIAVSTTSLARRLARPGAAGADAPQATKVTGLGLGATPRPVLANSFVAPTNDLEAEVARIWQEALGIAEVGIHDNFFDLGGNSLVGVRLIARLTERFGVPIRAVSIYEGPTVHALSLLIAGGEAPEAGLPAEATSRGARRRARRQRQTLGEPDS